MAQNIELSKSIQTISFNAADVERVIFDGTDVWPVYTADDIKELLWRSKPPLIFHEVNSSVDGLESNLYSLTDHNVCSYVSTNFEQTKKVSITFWLEEDNRTLHVNLSCILGGTIQEPQPMIFDILENAVEGKWMTVTFTIG